MTLHRVLRRIRRLARDALEDNQWLLPLLGCVLGIVLAQIFALAGRDPEPSTWTITVDRARDTLMGWLSIVFAALSIVLALASVTAQNVVGRYSSRLLRLYTRRSRDRQMIAIFATAAAFILAAQFRLRAFPADDLAPRGAVVVSFVLLIATGVTIIWYIGSLITWFRVDQTSRRIAAIVRRAARAETRVRRGDVDLPSGPGARPPGAVTIAAPRSGYVAGVDTGALDELAHSVSSVVVIERGVGDDVVRGEPLGWIGPVGTEHPQSGAGVEAAEMLDIVDFPVLDVAVEFGLVALVDVAIMALSPAVNDPTTAVRVLEEMGFLLPDLAEGDAGPYGRVDAEGRTRVWVTSWTFGDRTRLALEQIILYGESDPAVRVALDRVFEILQRLDVTDADRQLIADLAEARRR